MGSRGQNSHPPDPGADETRPAARPSTFGAGELLCNRFRVARLIARGGMGELYEAEDLTLGDRVALKTVRLDIAVDERANQRFRREVQLARRVTHPNICRIFDLFEHSSTESGAVVAFVTMELLQGQTLSEWLRRNGPPSVEHARPLIRQMAAALSAAHAVGVIHRDFKTNNVMLLDAAPTEAPRVVVTDFGLAHLIGEGAAGASITVTGDLVGTPDYMAPEQIEGTTISAATDIYAFGIVIYEMMTGERPFTADTPIASALRRISGPTPKTPREVRPDLPIEWDRAIMKCLARYPEGRFPDAMDVAAALDAAPAGPRAPHAPPSRGVLAAVVVGLLVVVVTGALMWRERRAPVSSVGVESSAPSGAAVATIRPAVAVLGFRNLSGQTDTQWLSTALSEMLTTELGAGERLRTVPGENVNRMKTELALADADSYATETLARIRQNLGADIVVSGSYVTVDSTLRVDIRLQDSREGQAMSVVSETGPSSQLLDIVSRAGGRLRERLGVDAVPAAMASVRASQPGSSDAARLYAEGLIRLRRFDALGARTLFDEAIKADPTYPLAHSALASTWSALGYDSRAKDAAERAFSLSSGLPRTERLLVEGTYREMSSQWKDAIGIWQTLATFFPDDVEYALRLADAQIASGAAKDGLMTVDAFRTRFPAVRDPRLDLSEASAAETLSDFKRMQTAAAAAGSAGEALGARLFVAGARLREGGAWLRLGESDRSVRLFEEARAIYAAAGDRAGVARTLNNLATAISDGPDTKRTRALYEEGLATARAVGEQDLVARFLNNIAVQERRAGNLKASLKMNQESLAIRRDIGDRTNAAISLNNIGNVLLDLGDLQGASQHYEESAAMSREMGDRRGLARALYNAAESWKLQGQIARSRTTYEESLQIRRGIEDPASVATSLYGVGHIAGVQGDLETATRTLTEALEMDRRLDRRRPMAYSLFQLGEIALVQGDFATARRRHQEALDIRMQLGEKGTAAESHTAQAWIALEEGRAADGEMLARNAAAVFKEQAAPGNEAVARAAMATATWAQNRRSPAEREIERALSLVKNPQHVLARMPVAIAAARIRGSSNPGPALRELDALRADAAQRGILRYELEARRAIAEIEGRRSLTAGVTLLEALRKDAKAKGFGLYAR